MCVIICYPIIVLLTQKSITLVSYEPNVLNNTEKKIVNPESGESIFGCGPEGNLDYMRALN